MGRGEGAVPFGAGTPTIVRGPAHFTLNVHMAGRAYTPPRCMHKPAHLILEVHMARRVDQVEDVLIPIGSQVLHPRRLQLDRDPTLALAGRGGHVALWSRGGGSGVL